MAGRNTIRDAVALRGGNRSVTLHGNSIITQMTLVQKTLEGGKILPWFLRVLDESLTVTAGDRTKALPTGFIRWDDTAGIWLYDSTAAALDRYVTKLGKQDWSYLVNEYGDSASDDTEAFDYDKTYIYIFPKADATDRVLKINYFKKETSVSTGDIDNAWTDNAADLFEAETAIRMARVWRDNDMLAMAQQDKQIAYDRLIGSSVAREVAEMGREMGGPD